MSKFVRPLIAIALLGVTCYLFVTAALEAKEILIIFGTITGFYFGERSALKKPDLK